MKRRRPDSTTLGDEQPPIDFFSQHFRDGVLDEQQDGVQTCSTKSSRTLFEHHTLQLRQNNGLDVKLRGKIGTLFGDSYSSRLHGLVARYLNVCTSSKEHDVEDTVDDALIESCRDQGLSQPKVLVLLPFKKFAFSFVKRMVEILLNGDTAHVQNWDKFEAEFGETEETALHRKWRAPEEFKVGGRRAGSLFQELLRGNIEDSFRVGVRLEKKGFRLFSAFDKSDLILGSPLGLRMIVGGEEEERDERELDFLASIELAIIYRNWEHLRTVLNSLNQVPREITADISRVRHWSLGGQGARYRQTLAFSHFHFAELHALFEGAETNFAGCAVLTRTPDETLDEIECPLVQELHRFDCQDAAEQADQRFAYFVRNVLPKLKQGTLVFISSYFDYVRLRNYLRRDNESFAQIHEYASDGKVRKSRKAFMKGEKKLLLMTERCHFFRHFLVGGVKAVVFYQVPAVPRFYVDVLNMAQPEGTLHATLLFSKTDVLRMQNVFGLQQTRELLSSPKKFHALIGE